MNEAQVLAIIPSSGKALEYPLRGDVSENIPKEKTKEVAPQRKKTNNEKKIYESDEEVVEVEKIQGEQSQPSKFLIYYLNCFIKRKSVTNCENL